MLQACRIITVWAALRASQERMKLACVLARKRALRSQLIRSPVRWEAEDMRRSDRRINDRRTIDDIIGRCRVCRLGLSHDGQPYIVPVCFGYDGHALYFHAATEGRKIDILKKNKRVCFEFDIPGDVITGDQACDWGMTYESVIGSGTAEILETAELKREGLAYIMSQYSKANRTFPEEMLKKTLVVRVEVAEISGKARR